MGLIWDATPKETIDKFLEHEVQMIIAYIAIAVLWQELLIESPQ